MGVSHRVLAIAAIAGTLDIGENFVFNASRGIAPAAVLRYIAAALLGGNAAANGAAPIGLGLAMHFTIALGWTLVYWFVSRRLAWMTRHAWIAGLVFGGVVYGVMNGIALHLTRLPPSHAVGTLAGRLNAVLALMVCIGWPIAWLTARWLPISPEV